MKNVLIYLYLWREVRLNYLFQIKYFVIFILQIFLCSNKTFYQFIGVTLWPWKWEDLLSTYFKIASTHCIQIFFIIMDLQSNLDVVRLGKLAELPLRLIESEPRDPCNDDVLRDNSAAISLTLRAWGNDGWNKHGLCNIHTGHLEIISQDARNALLYVLI